MTSKLSAPPPAPERDPFEYEPDLEMPGASSPTAELAMAFAAISTSDTEISSSSDSAGEFKSELPSIRLSDDGRVKNEAAPTAVMTAEKNETALKKCGDATSAEVVVQWLSLKSFKDSVDLLVEIDRGGNLALSADRIELQVMDASRAVVAERTWYVHNDWKLVQPAAAQQKQPHAAAPAAAVAMSKLEKRDWQIDLSKLSELLRQPERQHSLKKRNEGEYQVMFKFTNESLTVHRDWTAASASASASASEKKADVSPIVLVDHQAKQYVQLSHQSVVGAEHTSASMRGMTQRVYQMLIDLGCSSAVFQVSASLEKRQLAFLAQDAASHFGSRCCFAASLPLPSRAKSRNKTPTKSKSDEGKRSKSEERRFAMTHAEGKTDGAKPAHVSVYIRPFLALLKWFALATRVDWHVGQPLSCMLYRTIGTRERRFATIVCVCKS